MNRSKDLVQFFPWYCVNNVLNQGLVISWIYELRKRFFEYYDYFKSFQLNIQLEKGYQQAKLLSVKFPINLTRWTNTSYTSLRNETLAGTQILSQTCCLYYNHIYVLTFRLIHVLNFWLCFLFIREWDSTGGKKHDFFVWFHLFLLFENYLMNKGLQYTEGSCPILVGILLLTFHYRVALFQKKARKRNVMLVKTNKLEFLTIDQEFFSGDSTKCFMLFRVKRNIQSDVLNFQTNISVELILTFC